jgi:hypothetical protein
VVRDAGREGRVRRLVGDRQPKTRATARTSAFVIPASAAAGARVLGAAWAPGRSGRRASSAFSPYASHPGRGAGNAVADPAELARPCSGSSGRVRWRGMRRRPHWSRSRPTEPRSRRPPVRGPYAPRRSEARRDTEQRPLARNRASRAAKRQQHGGVHAPGKPPNRRTSASAGGSPPRPRRSSNPVARTRVAEGPGAVTRTSLPQPSITTASLRGDYRVLLLRKTGLDAKLTMARKCS